MAMFTTPTPCKYIFMWIRLNIMQDLKQYLVWKQPQKIWKRFFREMYILTQKQNNTKNADPSRQTIQRDMSESGMSTMQCNATSYTCFEWHNPWAFKATFPTALSLHGWRTGCLSQVEQQDVTSKSLYVFYEIKIRGMCRTYNSMNTLIFPIILNRVCAKTESIIIHELKVIADSIGEKTEHGKKTTTQASSAQ